MRLVLADITIAIARTSSYKQSHLNSGLLRNQKCKLDTGKILNISALLITCSNQPLIITLDGNMQMWICIIPNLSVNSVSMSTYFCQLRKTIVWHTHKLIHYHTQENP